MAARRRAAEADLGDDSSPEDGVERQRRRTAPSESEHLSATQGGDISSQAFDGGDLSDENDSAGTITKLDLTDFMNHRRLTLDFGPNLNFICGENGSGKSAILTSIILGLGGNVGATGRGSTSASAFIRRDKDVKSAIVRITLNNVGTKAFRPEVYGEKIHVEREIRKESSTYKTLNAKLKVVEAQARQEIANMCECFQIQASSILPWLPLRACLQNCCCENNPLSSLQVDNPVGILTQEAAKSFLTSKKPADMFKIYRRATQLEQLIEHYQKTKDNLDKTRESLKGSHNEFERLGDADRELESLLLQKAWSHIRDQRQVLAESQANRAQHDNKINQLSKKKEARQASPKAAQLAELETQRTKSLAEINLSNANLQQLEQTQKDMRPHLQTATQDFKTAKLDVKKLKDDILLKQREKQEISDTMQQRKEASYDQQEKLRKVEEQINSCEARIARHTEESDAAEKAIEQLNGEIDEAAGLLETRSASCRELQHQLDQATKRLQSLRKNQTNSVAIWGDSFPRILKAIDAQSGWHHKPLGPLGQYIALSDPKWAMAVEVMLMVADVVKISDPTVERVLMERKIDVTAVFEDKQRALTCCHGYDVAPDLKGGYLLNGDFVGTGPGKPYYSNARRQGARRLGVDVGDAMHRLKEEIQRLKTSLQEAEAHTAQVRNNLDKLRKDRQAQEKSKATAFRESQRLSKMLVELRESRVQGDQELDVSVYSNNIEQLNQELSELREQLDKAQEQAQQKEKKLLSLKASMSASNDQMQEILKRSDTINLQTEKIEEEMANISSRIGLYDKQIAEETRARTQIEERIAEIERSIEVTKQDLLTNGVEEVEVTWATDVLDQKIVALEHQKKDMQSRLGTREEAIQNETDAQKRLENVESRYKSLEKFARELDKSLERRMSQLSTFCSYCSDRVQKVFQVLLSHRNYSGSLRVDHQAGTLHLNVAPGHEVASTKSLSGGERSFSSICFIMSLWELMEAPFRCLDEFDVYMDMVNRTVAIADLVQLATSKSNRQFILLTPLKMIPIAPQHMDRVKIFKLSKHDESQSTLQM
ncbi:uncharacterized protein MONBRDRAFT_22018 [Monosiga brevicollis MX1]|uniref:RecF/RecN/SMC N-terminal domain-containing protein n=1 Tax=Monosiga brevicollis TaxID=81824 RepID=A9UPA8_MONBE|nr:uncharacterized protein MONBRDRAFT_22018 [Monosiga brevicollis MX1]EDQ92843.1 predicted protein [Monosiga brevicollis MX1]|eukprot:XP_001742605.1 hypothetical protein [Monosiga brevicollis MX1]